MPSPGSAAQGLQWAAPRLNRLALVAHRMAGRRKPDQLAVLHQARSAGITSADDQSESMPWSASDRQLL